MSDKLDYSLELELAVGRDPAGLVYPDFSTRLMQYHPEYSYKKLGGSELYHV